MRASTAIAVILSILCLSSLAADPGPRTADGRLTLIAWNDLGMHCMQSNYSNLCILPPANTIQALVIRRGVEPVIISSRDVRYLMQTNQQVQLHTNLWTYSQRLFGVLLTPGTGLTGNRTTGAMRWNGMAYEASAVPALPISDNGTWNPYQIASVKLRDNTGRVIARTEIVVPVSDEMNCAKCHASGQVAAKALGGTVETNILKLHNLREKTMLLSQRPVLCASCHSDNALGAAGKAGVSSVSKAMHSFHAGVARQPTCIDCHPGARTQCNRSAISGMGGGEGAAGCVRCHGTLTQMAQSLNAGRQPWIQEPTCAQCHGAAYSTGTTLFRKAKGHGGIACIACHNSPHAWLPSLRGDDNAQAIALQGNSKAIGYRACSVCHTDGRMADMPPHEDE